MCIKNAQFDGSIADIRKALAAGTPLYFKYPNKRFVTMEPHPETHQVRDNDGRKGFKVIVNGETKILVFVAGSGWQLHCGSKRCA